MFILEADARADPATTTSQECASRQGQRVKVQGFVHRIRALGGANFIVLRDQTGTVQVFAKQSTPGFAGTKEGFVVEIHGLCKSEPRAPGGFEVVAEKIEVLVAPQEELPITINKDALRVHLNVDINNRPITLRHYTYRSLFKIQEGLARGFRRFLTENDFTEIFTPKIVGMGTEGGANVFSLEYFGKTAYLAQSPQLYKQIMVGVFGKVFEIAHVFRAEPHDTARHLNEYVSMDFEMGFIKDFRDIMSVQVVCLHSMFQLLGTSHNRHLEALGLALPDTSKIPVLHVKEAHELVLRHSGEDFRGRGELSAREENLLGKAMKEGFGYELVFVTHYGSSARPFYAMDDPENPEETLSFDLLFRGVEITTGGQRIHDYSQLVSKMRARGMNVGDFTHYLMAFRYGMPPHGGLAMGLERITSLLAGYDNVRYGSLFPRDMLRLAPWTNKHVNRLLRIDETACPSTNNCPTVGGLQAGQGNKHRLLSVGVQVNDLFPPRSGHCPYLIMLKCSVQKVSHFAD